jgi:signal transduction histidine kinase
MSSSDGAGSAEELLARRDDLYALVFHDLRNPLNTISMSCALLADDVTPAGRDTVARIKRAVDKMEKLMRDISELLRLESGQVKLELVSLGVADVLNHAFEPFIQKAAAKTVKLETGAIDPALRFDIERERFGQALAAMIDNAIRHSPDGGLVRLGARVKDGLVEVSVSDNGPGVPAEDQPTVFSRHLRVNKKRGSGLGLGLAIAGLVAKLHGGSVGVESEPDKGATFFLRVKKA